MTLLENWLCRKEEEYRSRVSLPTPELQKSDSHLYHRYDSKLKAARERLTAKMISMSDGQKSTDYDSLTTEQLHDLTESLVVRLNMFKQKYPAFLP
jgi:hypothetical protein